jgi:hypothetical protein
MKVKKKKNKTYQKNYPRNLLNPSELPNPSTKPNNKKQD